MLERNIIAPSLQTPAHLGCLSHLRPLRTRSPSTSVCSRASPAVRRVVRSSLSHKDVGTAPPKQTPSKRDTLRLAIPSKGRMAEDTQQLLKDCQLSVYKPNPRQYTAQIPLMPQLEVWFQRASDVVRKLSYGDFDLGIVGLDMFAELSHGDPDLVVVHDALDFGHCHLGLGVPMGGKFADISTLDQLRNMPEWSESNPLRVVTGYQNVARKFFQEQGFEHVVLLSADGALEAAPLMGSADIILDLVSTGVTLRENNLKELEGGHILWSQGALVANRRALKERPGLLEVVHELIERFEAHLKAGKFYSVLANMRGNSAEEVAQKLLDQPGLSGLQGPTISTVYNKTEDGTIGPCGYFDCTICIPKKQIYAAVKGFRQAGGSGVVVSPITYIFEEEPARWRKLLDTLELEQ